MKGKGDPLWSGSAVGFTHWPGRSGNPTMTWRSVSTCQGPCHQVGLKDRFVTNDDSQLGEKKAKTTRNRPRETEHSKERS